MLSDGDAREDLEDVELVEPDEPADVVVIGGASDDFTYATINHIFRLLMDGAALVGMHRNMFWRTATAWSWTAAPTSQAWRRPPACAHDLREAGAHLLPGRARTARRAGLAPRWSATTL